MAGKRKKNVIHYGGKKVPVAPFYQTFAESLWRAIGRGQMSPIDVIAQGMQAAYLDGLNSKER